MKKYIIERDIPEVGAMGPEQLRAAAAKSNDVLQQLGRGIQWLESYVAADKTFCVYLAKDEAIIRRHAELSGFPATRITEIGRVIDPSIVLALEEQHSSAGTNGVAVSPVLNRLRAVLGACALVFALLATATAQTESRASVPFEFKVGNTTLDAGTYTIERVNADSQELLALRDSSGHRRVIVNGVRIESIDNSGNSRLLFTKIDDHYFLTQIWRNDTGAGVSIPLSSPDKDVELGKRHHADKTKPAVAD